MPGISQDYSLSFDGTNDYVSIGDLDDFDIEHPYLTHASLIVNFQHGENWYGYRLRDSF